MDEMRPQTGETILWSSASSDVRTLSRGVFGAAARLPVIAGIGRLVAAGDRVFTYQDIQWAAGVVQYQEVLAQVQRLARYDLVELVDDEWRHYWRAVESPLWAAALALVDADLDA